MKNIESGFQNDAISTYEKEELFSVEKWKLTRAKSLEVKNVIKKAEAQEKNPNNIIAHADRAWQSLDEQSELLTKNDIKNTETLIAGIEDKYPEITKFAPEQYC